MKKLLLIIYLFIPFLAYNQTISIDSVKWISDDLGYLHFYKDEVHFNFDGHEQFKRFKWDKDTLIMVDNYTTSADNYSKRHIDLFKFLIQSINSKSLTLKPIGTNAYKLVNKPVYHFKNIDYIRDPKVKYTKLTFNSSTCYGTCPELTIEIDNSGYYYLLGGMYADPYKGYFKGMLTAKQLSRLNYLVQHSQIKKMYNWKQGNVVMDAPNYRLTINSNYKPLYLNTNEPPLNMTELIEFLLNSYKQVTLVQDQDKHKFE